MTFKEKQIEKGLWKPRPNSRQRRRDRYWDWRNRRAEFIRKCRETGAARPVVRSCFAEDEWERRELRRLRLLGDPR